MYNKEESQRFFVEGELDNEEYRTAFRRDFARVMHSPSFRRLAGKTQLFPSGESDFFRNRLTHSLEVAQIAKTIAIKINETILKDNNNLKIDLDVVEFAGISHDLGHPPFGHQGEEILAECMYNFGGFEGNAQTLRVLSKIDKKIQNGYLDRGGFDENGNDRRFGLNITYRSLASILKYDVNISDEILSNAERKNKVIKGYYSTESTLVDKMKESVLLGRSYDGEFKTIECQIMDIADDIAYSTYDLEDAFKAGFISPIDMLIQNKEFYELVSESIFTSTKIKINKDEIINILSDLIKFIFILPDDLLKGVSKLSKGDLSEAEYLFLGQQYSNKYNQLITNNGYVRRDFTSQLIESSIANISMTLNPEIPAMSKVVITESTKIRIEILKRVAFLTQVLSPKLKASEHRGKKIIKKIFESIAPDKDNIKKVPELLPKDVQLLYIQNDDINHKYRIVCDFIACMTDKYALEFYDRISSGNLVSIFRPIS